MSEFVRASLLYDVETGERVRWDWSGQQSVAESEARVQRAVAEAEQEG
ncbi:hypothetical protein ACFQMA_01235 [Halosimplex aquaticum]|uniref:Uncharacterized protein n=1 Tax=Halosimplex aquaticum TaxID=3026162 RepID=A0ABD5Y218_9EURY|nr:hypothetical protein [Halosimplex aquaticum]